jgi:hypothetical protein
MTIWAYGDSFVAGDQDIPGRIDAIEENMEFNRYNISFAHHLANSLDTPLINRAISGCSNFVQLDKLWLDFKNFKKNDIVLFGITTAWRDRFLIPYECPSLLKKTVGPKIINRELIEDKNFTKIPIIDLFYLLSVIEKLEKNLDIKIIKFNLFHDVLLEASAEEKEIFKFSNFIGLGIQGNTLIDVLTDNWGKFNHRISDHSKWTPPKKFRHLFTAKSHPNAEGHKIISQWLELEIKKIGLV